MSFDRGTAAPNATSTVPAGCKALESTQNEIEELEQTEAFEVFRSSSGSCASACSAVRSR